jgi:hypothetical protein
VRFHILVLDLGEGGGGGVGNRLSDFRALNYVHLI